MTHISKIILYMTNNIDLNMKVSCRYILQRLRRENYFPKYFNNCDLYKLEYKVNSKILECI
jgi:hypothetical protein